tara:strand:- start:10055 stop:10312 length:258 start_codon:yes stop_codon:yes gene_type:complete
MDKIEIDKDCQFLKDIESKPNYNGVPLGVYNLITTKGALKLLIKGIKPHKNFDTKDVKKYFGIDGEPKTLLYKLETISQIIKGEI